MKPLVDQDRCQGHGRCYAIAPEVFEPDDDAGYAELLRDELSAGEEGLMATARQAADACPERAITLVE